MTSDGELLRRYTKSHSEDAFAELVRRHLDLVYSAALRQVNGDAHLAQDVAQSVFTDLSRKARQLVGRQALAGWLYTGAHYAAAKAARTEQRRHTHEQEAHDMHALLHDPSSNSDWESLRPVLDSAMHELSEADREVILLRYFENQPHAEIGKQLGLSDDTTRKRIERVLEKLRIILSRRGITTSAAALSVVLTANAVQAAPVGLAVTVATTAAVATAATAITTTTIATTMNWINLKSLTAVVAAAVTAGTATHFVQQREANRLRKENQQFVAARDQLTNERDAALSEAANGKNELARLQKNQSELLRLRGEVGVLRKELSAQANRAGQQPARTPSTAQPAGNVGAYLSTEQLAFAGYATPEAAAQSLIWGSINGTFEDFRAALIPQQPEKIDEPKEREKFEYEKKTKWAALKGFQMVAKKVLADDKAELKVRLDVDLPPGQQGGTQLFIVQPMAKVGNEWKASGSGMKYQEDWDRDGQIQTFTQ